jgi:hypothetical protein
MTFEQVIVGEEDWVKVTVAVPSGDTSSTHVSITVPAGSIAQLLLEVTRGDGR